MQFDPDNKVVKLCAEGMEFEGTGDHEKAHRNFLQAWEHASDNSEKFIAAHYLARHQKSVTDKLHWDEVALQLALEMNDETTYPQLPSLHLNIGKCYEDLNNFSKANENYLIAKSFTSYLPDDGYGNMIKAGIENGIARIENGTGVN